MPAGIELVTTGSPNVTLSADGGRIAFVGGTGGLRRLYVRRFDDADATQLRGTETVNSCFFSPDARAIGFITSDRVLKKVSLGDGLVTILASDADHNIAGGVWAADDSIVFGRAGGLWEIPGNGSGSARQLTSLDPASGERGHAWPTVVSGGKAVLFTTLMARPRMTMRIDAVVRATGERHVVVDSGSFPMYASSGHLVFFRDNALLAAPFDLDTLKLTGAPVVVVENIALDQLGAPMAALSGAGTLAYVIPGSATRRLVWVSRQGVESPINDTPRPYQNPRLSPDGNRIVVENAGGHLWLQDVTRSTFQPLTSLTSPETIGNTYATWTPRSQRVVFRTVAGLWVLDPNGDARPQPIAGTSVYDIPTSVTPDGLTLAFIRQAGGAGGDLYVMPLDGSAEPRPLVATPGYDGGGQFSPDGRWMAYVSNESGQFEVYVRPYPGPERRVPVSTQGGTHVKWNPNGKELFYRTGNKMMAVDVSIRAGDIVLSQPRVLFEQRYAFGGAQTVANYDVSPDGQRFVMVKDDSASGRLNVVLNWTEELKIRVPLN